MSANKGMKEHLREYPRLWMGLWILVVVNFFAITTIVWGFSLVMLLCSCVIAIIGLLGVGLFAAKPAADRVDEEIQVNVAALMEEIRPVCDEVFQEEVEQQTQPVILEIQGEFSRSLEWLWEDTAAFLERLKAGVTEVKSGIRLLGDINEKRSRTLKSIEEAIKYLQSTILEFDDERDKSKLEMSCRIHEKAEELTAVMEAEKEVFYETVKNRILQQVSNDPTVLDKIPTFNVGKLGEQFSGVIEKSIQTRLEAFEEGLIQDIENISADIVGKMQKGTLQVLNVFKELEKWMDQLLDDYRGENSLAIRRLTEVRARICNLREEANELMVSLAWQDIMQEKRWIEIQERLSDIREQVLANVDEEVLIHLTRVIGEQIPGLQMIPADGTGAGTMLMKSLLDAEVLYQVYESKNLQEVIQDGVYVLLQYIAPVELLAETCVNPSELRLQLRRTAKHQVKRENYKTAWAQVTERIRLFNPALLPLLQDVFPRAFMIFCNSIRVRRSPEDLNQAAWMIYMDLCEARKGDEEDYLLVGLLLCMHALRSRYIHPMRKLPLPLENDHDIELMRSCAYKSVALMMR